MNVLLLSFFQIQFTEKVNPVLILTVYKTLLRMCSYRYKTSENTTSKLNPGKANICSALCKSFVIFPGMFPYCFLLCFIPCKVVIFLQCSPCPFRHSNWSFWFWLRPYLREQHILVGSVGQQNSCCWTVMRCIRCLVICSSLAHLVHCPQCLLALGSIS